MIFPDYSTVGSISNCSYPVFYTRDKKNEKLVFFLLTTLFKVEYKFKVSIGECTSGIKLGLVGISSSTVTTTELW
jgi:hypothetical protein